MLKLHRRALAVQTRTGTLTSRKRRQPHPVKQIRGLLVEHRGPIVGCSRTQVSGLDLRHTPRLMLCLTGG
jgi:hypothetical protein